MTANDRQIGGTHYATTDGKPQHWDLVILYSLDYFQAQITKYLLRWKTKHSTPEKRLEDLKKARHFLDKYIENYTVYDTRPPSDVVEPAIHGNEDWTVEGYVILNGKEAQVYKCKHCRLELTAPTAAAASEIHNHAADPTRNYVDQ